jgi:transcriptional regulator with XRE-family HTH domain
MSVTARPVGDFLREWRQRRRMSQLDLALEAEISSRHLSFIETGRARPSRDMILHLCERLTVPLRERNVFLLAAGYAPVFPKRPLDDPALGPARKAVELVLSGHEPYPALAVDRHWNLVTANRAIPPLMTGAAADLLEPPVNVLRLSLHPQGLAPRVVNLAEWRGHLLARLRQQIDASADAVLIDLHRELSGYPMPSPPNASMATEIARGGVVAPLNLQTDAGPLALFSTTTVFGTPIDVTLAELAIEAFFPADEATAEQLRALCKPGQRSET